MDNTYLKYLKNQESSVHQQLYANALDKFYKSLPYIKVNDSYIENQSNKVKTIIEFTNGKFNIKRQGVFWSRHIENTEVKNISYDTYKTRLANTKFINEEDKQQLYNTIEKINNLQLDSFENYVYITEESIGKIVEIPNSAYYASEILIYYTDTTSKQYRLSLENYWENSYILLNTSKGNIMKFDDDTLKTGEIKKIDYLNNKLLIYSKYTDKEVWISGDTLNQYKLDESFKLNTFKGQI